MFDGLVIVCNVSRLVSPVMVLAVIVGHPELRLANFYRYFARLCRLSSSAIGKSNDDGINNNNRLSLAYYN